MRKNLLISAGVFVLIVIFIWLTQPIIKEPSKKELVLMDKTNIKQDVVYLKKDKFNSLCNTLNAKYPNLMIFQDSVITLGNKTVFESKIINEEQLDYFEKYNVEYNNNVINLPHNNVEVGLPSLMLYNIIKEIE